MAKVKTESPKYEGRNDYCSGDNYGIGEASKVGKLRSSYMQQGVPQKKKKFFKPPTSVR